MGYKAVVRKGFGAKPLVVSTWFPWVLNSGPFPFPISFGGWCVPWPPVGSTFLSLGLLVPRPGSVAVGSLPWVTF